MGPPKIVCFPILFSYHFPYNLGILIKLIFYFLDNTTHPRWNRSHKTGKKHPVKPMYFWPFSSGRAPATHVTGPMDDDLGLGGRGSCSSGPSGSASAPSASAVLVSAPVPGWRFCHAKMVRFEKMIKKPMRDDKIGQEYVYIIHIYIYTWPNVCARVYLDLLWRWLE